MKQKKVWLLSGIPGSGKSTWIQAQLKINPNSVWCSRDNVRFKLLQDNEDYFSREEEVLIQWITSINEAMANPDIENIYIDATHLTDKARNNVINQIYSDDFTLYHVVFDVPLAICLERNAKRAGRARVPDSVIQKMYKSFRFPTSGNIILIDENGKEKENE